MVDSRYEIMPNLAGSMGRPIPGRQVVVVDEDGNPVPTRQVGEITGHRPELVMFLGCRCNAEANQVKLTNVWRPTSIPGRLNSSSACP